MDRFPCPCCGHLVFHEPPGSFGICPICYWQDDALQLRYPRMPGGANVVSLEEAQRNFAAVGAVEPRFRNRVRHPLPDEPREPGWRPLGPEDQVDESGVKSRGGCGARGVEGVLYYWRPEFGRAASSA